MPIFNPTNTPVISKITVGNETYYLKDAEARALLAQLGDAAKKNVATTGVNADEQGLVTGAQVQAALNAVSGALQFVGKYDSLEAANTSGETFKNGDIILVGVKEYIRYDNAWVELGDEGIYALKSVTIGTQNLSANINLDTLKTDLGLGALAFKDSAKGTVAAQTISGVKATGTTAGSIAVGLTQTETAAALTRGDYKPEGSISGTVTATGSVSIAKDAENGTQISGSVSAPTVTVTPATAQVQFIDSVGTQAKFTEGAFSQGTLPSFTQGAKASWSASVDDQETLSFSFTANGTDTFSEGTLPTKAADSFTANALPTKGTATTVVTGISKAEATAPTFTGDKFTATFAGTAANIAATFEGTTATGALVTDVKYSKATVDAAATGFTGAEVEFKVGDIAVAAKDVTVQ